MNGLVALTLGAGLGAGLWLLALWAWPPRPPLARVLTALADPVSPAPLLAPAGQGGWLARWGRPLVGPLRRVGQPRLRVRDDLRVLGRDPADHLAAQGALALLGLLTPMVLDVVLSLAGGGLGLGAPLIAGLAATVGFVAPDLAVRRAAAARRTEFRHALSAYLDLVVISLAGGSGVDSALHSAARVGQGWAFERLHLALDAASLTRTTPWARLRQLGVELSVTELSELASSVALAGTEGARVRASLATKAAALRARETSEIESAAHAATERMALPVTALLAGFVVFIGYPALMLALGSL